MKILVIGASGMIGSRIVSEASARGHEVIAAARHPANIPAQTGLSTIELNVYDHTALAQA
ncbi:MAG: NAD(P)H-binding protein, partial [Thiothrix sp.]|nr:NAD(P)H-binding protein [Thiothrix sp.]